MPEDRRHNNPDIEYFAWITYPYARIRVEIGVEDGDVRWFIVQLECNTDPEPYADNEWQQVARFDHHPQTEWGHDVTVERLHLDVYRDGEKERIRRGFPPIAVNDAPDYCQRYLERHATYYLEQFENWHGLDAMDQYRR